MKRTTFNVFTARRMPEPIVSGIKRFFLLCEIHDLPMDFSLKPNPRERKSGGKVMESIRESLADIDSLFHVKNRGLLLTASEWRFSEKDGIKEVTLTFMDEENHGVVDGGHTYKAIKELRDEITHKVYVNIEVMVLDGEDDENIQYELASARNTSAQVEEKALANLANKFDTIKDRLKTSDAGIDVENDISFTQFDCKPIDVKQIISLMTVFCYDHVDIMGKKQRHPIMAYGNKEKCLHKYLDMYEKYGISSDNPYMKLYNILPDIIKLANYIEERLPDVYSGHYGKLKEVKMSDKPMYRAMFSTKKLKYKTHKGWLFPAIAALRALVREDNNTGYYVWVCDPFECFDKLGGNIIDLVVEQSKSVKNNPATVGKTSGAWTSTYMTAKAECR